MPLKIDPPWQPVALRGNYLTFKNPQTGETRKTYISQGELAGIRADLAKYNKLRLGLGYPWNPVGFDGTYIIYKSSVSGLTTQAFVPPELRDIASQFLKASGAPGSTQVIDLSPTGAKSYEYIDRGNFSTLRDISTARDISISPWMSHPYTIRQGIVSRVIDGSTLVVDGVVVSIRNTDTPLYAQNKAGWQAAKDYTTSLLLNKQVTLKILTDMPRDNAGNTVADVTVASEDVAGKIMIAGNAPLKSAEPQFGGFDWLTSYQYEYQAEAIKLMWYLKTRQWGSAKMTDKYIAGDIFAKAYQEFVINRRKAYTGQYADVINDNTRKEDELRLFLLTIGGNIASDVLMIPGIGKKLIGEPAKWLLKPAHTRGMEWLNSFERPMVETGAYARVERLWRQSLTLPRPAYHVWNAIGDVWNAMLGGLRDPGMLIEADKIIKLPSGTQMLVDSAGKPLFVSAIEGGEKVAFVSSKGRAYTVAELKYYQEYYHFERIGQSGGTTGKAPDIIDKAFAPLQKASEYENARLRYSSFLDRLQKGDEVEQAFAHSTHYLIDYSPKSLTAFEQAYLYPNIPFYMFMRQNTILQLTEFVSQPQTYAVANKLLDPFRPTTDEYSRLRDYQKGFVLVRNPADPTSFIRFRLPFENVANLASSLSTQDQAILLTYPWLSAFPELMTDRNFFDNTRPSKNYPLYFTKKISSAYYYTARDYATIPLPQFLLKLAGIDVVTPAKAETDVSSLLQNAGMAKTQEILQFEATQKKIQYENRRSANLQNLMHAQTAIRLGVPYTSTYIKEDGTTIVNTVVPTAPGMPDRPVEFGGLDWLGALEYTYTAEAINLMWYLKTGHWGSAKMEDKIDPGVIFTRLYTEKLAVGRGRMREQWGTAGVYLDDTAQFLIGLGGAIGGDITLIVGWGKDPVAKTLQWGTKDLQLSSKGEKLYNTFRISRGDFEAKWLTIQAAKSDSTLVIGRGLHIIGTSIEVPHTAQLGDVVWKYAVTPAVIKPIRYVGSEVFSKSSDLVKILHNSIGVVGEKPDMSAFNSLLRDLKNEMRTKLQAAKADIWILQDEAHSIFGTGYQNVVRQLIEDESLRAKYPSLKPIIDRIIARNYAMASIEIAWKLLDATRANYILHEMMPQALEVMEKGKLKMPPMKESLSSSDRNMFVAMGRVLNPYNFERTYGMTIDAINAWSMKEQGFAIFFEDAFGLMRTREEMHVTSVSIKEFIDKIGKEFGEPIGTKLNGYGVSKIQQLKNVQLPKEVIKWLEDVDLIKANTPELNKPGIFGRGLQVFDFFQRAYKIGVTFGNPSWLQGNMWSGLFVDAKYAKMLSINPYKNAWTELARGSSILRQLFKMSEERAVFKDALGNELTAEQLMKEAADANVLGSQGMTDIGNYAFGMRDNAPAKIMKAMYWALTNSENVVRLPLFFKYRLEGRTVEEAKAIVIHYHGDYSGAALSPFEKQVARRLLNFYIWDKFAPTLLIKEALAQPSSLTIPYHIMTAWNGQQGLTEKQYLTDRELVRTIFRIPGTDAYTTPAIFSLANSAFKYSYIFASTERGFYWEELQKDPDLLVRFIKGDIDSYILKHGAGVVKIEGNKATITYAETGDHISAMLNQSTNKLVFMDDQTGQILKEYPINTIDGKIGIYKELSIIDRIERVMGEIGAAAVTIPLELALNKDFRFGSPIDKEDNWFVNQFVGSRSVAGRSLAEYTDPTIPVWEKFADLAIGWSISHLSHNPNIPWQDKTADPVKKMIYIEVWKIERGDAMGCGW